MRRLYRWLKARLLGPEWPDYPALPDRCVGGKRLGWIEMSERPKWKGQERKIRLIPKGWRRKR